MLRIGHWTCPDRTYKPSLDKQAKGLSLCQAGCQRASKVSKVKMRCVFKQGKQRELLIKSIEKVGSERKLSKLTGFSKGAINRYKFEKHHMPTARLSKIAAILCMDINEVKRDIIRQLPNSWGQKKGGLAAVSKKKKEGTFESNIEMLRQISSERMKRWHAITKKRNPLKYFQLQFDRFKKVGNYPIVCNNIKVRNWLEAEIAEFLSAQRIKFEYETCIIVKGKAYFPDFKAGNLLIEATFWSHPRKERIDYLNSKISDYEEAGYEVVFFVPPSHRKFYKELGSTVLSDLKDLKRVPP
jgi:hypothetical protein